MATKRLTRGQAIRAFCIECMGGDLRLPRDCTVTGAPRGRIGSASRRRF
ncbi:MAG: hypothetical protein IPK07_26465 [Deltaproteobacteria bacterium]|nr:hypothetical protein [Deltaproteobacteria bacterium]